MYTGQHKPSSSIVIRLTLYGLCLLFITIAQGVTISSEAKSSVSRALQSDPSIVGQWAAPTPWPSLTQSIVAIHLHLLPNGKVLAWDRNNETLTSRAYLWDPNGGAVSYYDNGYTNVFCSGHAFLPDGRLLVTGGHHLADGNGEPHTNVFDYITSTWTNLANMNNGRWYPTTTTLENGNVLVISGDIITPNRNTIPQVRETDKGGGWRTLVAPTSTPSLYPWMYLAPDGKVFNAGPSKETLLLDTSGTGTWSTGYPSNCDCSIRDYGSSVMYDVGKVLIVGGGSIPNGQTTDSSKTAEVIDLNVASPTWRTVNPMANARRQMNATILADGTVLVTGGTNKGGFNDSTGSVLAAELWTPVTEAWSTMASMQVRRLYHSTAVLLPDGRVLSAGGGAPADTLNGDTDHKDAEIFSPPYLFKGAQPVITNVPTKVVYGQQFVVTTPDAASITKVTLIRLSSVTHSFNENQRLNYLSYSAPTGAGRLDVFAPANGKVCPPGHYMLFIVNGNGATSVGKFIRVWDRVLDTAINFGVADPNTFGPDRKTDYSVWRPAEGIWSILRSDNSTISYQWGAGSQNDVVVPGDYDGDTITDFAVWRPGEGRWYIRQSSTGTFKYPLYGAAGDIPVPADYDGDGRTDIALWRPSEGMWYVTPSFQPSPNIFRQLGAAGDKPVPGDYDGDGRVDFAVWRPTTGQWFITLNSTGPQPPQTYGAGFSPYNDVPVPADYDGDGKTDLAVWRPSEGRWYILQSSTGTSIFPVLGIATDIPVPGDYDGDGKTDIAVWRPSNLTWYILESSSGNLITRVWGTTGADIPLPSAYVRR